MKNLIGDRFFSPAELGDGLAAAVFLKNSSDIKSARRFFKDEVDLNIEFMQGGINTAIKYFRAKKSPAVVVSDISNEELPASRIQELRQVCLSDCRFIAIGDIDSISLYRQLKDLGVDEYFTKPIPLSQLKTRLKAILGGEAPRSPRKIGARNIGILGAAGGVGTTSIACSVADILAQHYRRKTLLLDMQENSPAASACFNRTRNNGLGVLCSNPNRIDKLLFSRNVEKLNDRLDLLVSGVKAGRMIDELIVQASHEFPYPINAATKDMCGWSAAGCSIDESLYKAAVKYKSYEFMFLSSALAMQRRSGGQLSSILVRLRDTLKEQEDQRKLVRSLVAEGKSAATVILVLIVVLLTFLLMTNPYQARFFLEDEVGREMVGYCLLSLVSGFIVIHIITGGSRE
ncbi:type II secretion system F family protein [Sneathiella glossodoripedis]|uniref:type II secretion system F family protein n=1 Tax=Sneathiella glossodoripedis TaxID=418853 RepID=UPI0004702CA1|nr:type II secretion system F family protein [Sneathiella glossodoripedis]